MESIKNFDYDDAKASVQTSSENTPTKKPEEPAEIEGNENGLTDNTRPNLKYYESHEKDHLTETLAMLIESDESKTASKSNIRNNYEKLQSEKETKELEHKEAVAKKQIDEPALDIKKVTTTVEQQNFVANSNDFPLAIPQHTANYYTVENFSKKDMDLLSFENFLTQQQAFFTPVSQAFPADTRNTNLLSGTRQDLDPANQLFPSNPNSVQVVRDNFDASLTPGKHFQSKALNIQNSDLSNNQQHPLLFIQNLQQPLFMDLEHCGDSPTIQNTDVIHCGPIDHNLLQLQGTLETEEDKGNQNQLRYQIQNNMSNENQQAQTIIVESSPIPESTLHSDRNSRIDQPEFHSNDHSNNTQNEEVVNNIDEITFPKQNSPAEFPILQHARNLTSSDHQIKDDVGLPLAIYNNQKQNPIIAISEKPHNSVRSKIMDMENSKSSNDTKPYLFPSRQPCLFNKGLPEAIVQSRDCTTNTENIPLLHEKNTSSYSQLNPDLFHPHQISQEKKTDVEQRVLRDQWQQTCLQKVSSTQIINKESNNKSEVIVQWNRRDKSINGNEHDNELESNVRNCHAQKHPQHQDVVTSFKEMVIAKLQQGQLNKPIYSLDFPVTDDTVKENSLEGHLNVNVDVASGNICNQEQPTLTPISKIQGGQFQSVPPDKQNTNNMNNFSQCNQLKHDLLRREQISETNIDENEQDQLTHQVKQREPQNTPQNQNINIELRSQTSATAKPHRHMESFVATDHMNSSQKLPSRDSKYYSLYNLQVVKSHPQQAYSISSIRYNYKKHRKFRIFCRKTLYYKGNKNKMVPFSPERMKQGNQKQNSRNIAGLNLSGNDFQHQRKAFHQKIKWPRFLKNSHHINNAQKHPELQQILPNSTQPSLLRGSSQNHHSSTPQRQTFQNNPTPYQNDCAQCSSGSTGSSKST